MNQRLNLALNRKPPINPKPPKTEALKPLARIRILSITHQDEDVRDEDQDIEDKPGATVRFGLGFSANFTCLNSLGFRV